VATVRIAVRTEDSSEGTHASGWPQSGVVPHLLGADGQDIRGDQDDLWCDFLSPRDIGLYGCIHRAPDGAVGPSRPLQRQLGRHRDALAKQAVQRTPPSTWDLGPPVP